MTKTQKQLLLLGGIVVAGAGVLVYILFGSSAPTTVQGEYQPPTVDTALQGNVFDNPEYPKLSSPVHLPLDPGPAGRPNPFDAF